MAPATYPDPNLEPQNQSSFEVGTDLRFFNGRIRLDATYYYNKTTKNIVRLDVANSTGFFYMRKNAVRSPTKASRFWPASRRFGPRTSAGTWM